MRYKLQLKHDIKDTIYGIEKFYPKGTLIKESDNILELENYRFPTSIDIHGHGVDTYAFKNDCEIIVKQEFTDLELRKNIENLIPLQHD